MAIEDLEKQKKLESLNSDNESDNTAQTVGRLAAGATPALFSFLFGPQQTERGIAQSQKFFAAGKPSKLVPIVGPEGTPIYETPEGAIGEKIVPKTTTKNGSFGTPQEYVNTKTNQKMTVQDSPGGLVSYFDKKPVQLDADWVKSYAPSMFQSKGLSGRSTHYTINKSTGKVEAVQSEAGVGDYFTDESGKPIPADEAKSYVSGLKTLKEKMVEPTKELTSLNRVYSILDDPKATTVEVTNAVESLKRTAGEKKLSDKESDRAEAEKMYSIATMLEDIYSRRVNERERPAKIASFKSLAKGLIDEKTSYVRALKDVYAPETKSKGKKEAKERAFGDESSSRIEQQNKALDAILKRLGP